MAPDSFYKQHTQPNITSSAPASPLPAFIGPYKIEALLTRGGMGNLYLGLDPDSKKPLAIKTLPLLPGQDPALVEHFRKEARVIALSNHPNIVKLYREGSYEEGLYIAMEWVHGISLRQFLAQQSFSLKRSLEIVLQISYALQHLHSHGIIHRDLKPENILIAENGDIKVIDFGIAQLVQEPSVQKAQGILGTPNYMSPEQTEDASQATYASDIYSLGVITYELITGKPSFGMIELSLLPKHLRKIVQKALASSPLDRYQTVEEWIREISSYLYSEEIEQEKPEQDGVKEFLETFQKISVLLTPTPPSSEILDIGLAKTRASSQFGLYYDLFKLPGDRFFFVMASSKNHGIASLFSAAMLRGYVQASFSSQDSSEFKPIEFIKLLQKHMKADPLIKDFSFSSLYLDPSTDTLTFFNAGLSQLIHCSPGSNPRVLHSMNPPLSSEDPADLSETTDNWSVGDILIYHSLIPEELQLVEQASLMEGRLSSIVEQEALLSAQPQAEAIIRSCSLDSLFSLKQTHALLSIQRMA